MSGLLWAYAKGGSVAHLMRYDRRFRDWASPCSYDVHRPYSDLHFVDIEADAPRDLPLTPWCSRCRDIAGREASAQYAAGLLDGLVWVVMVDSVVSSPRVSGPVAGGDGRG